MVVTTGLLAFTVSDVIVTAVLATVSDVSTTIVISLN